MLSSGNRTGTYTSRVFNAGTPAVWHSINWSENFTYNYYSSLTGVVGWWRMNEIYWTGIANQVVDSSGNSYHLRSYGNANTTNNALFNRAGFFDGNGDYLQRNTNSLSPSNWSVEAWIRRNDSDSLSPIISYDVHYRLEVYNSHLRIGKDFGDGYDWLYAESTTGVPQNEWVHAVGTWNGTSLAIYYNGILEGIVSSSSGLIVMQFNPPFYIGRQGVYYFNGSIDEATVYNRTLSQTEILEHYNKGVMSLNASVRSCDDANCIGESWSAEYDNSSHNNLNEISNKYFQFMFSFTAGNETNTPLLYNVNIDYEIS
jgi:hypothetical protein